MSHDAEGPMDANGVGYEAECAGCDAFTIVDDLMLCAACAACAGKLDRDMIRQRDWAYSATAWAVPQGRREKLRAEVIREHGAKLELIAPFDGSKSPESTRIGRAEPR